ncbi:hypothetical protein [Ferirhizobium litorale]|nr:hypothetical protein [Fererhizobium litorale]
MADTLTRFRVHFEDGEKIDVTAADAGRLLDGIEHNAFPEIRL